MQPKAEESPLLVLILYKCWSGTELSPDEQQVLDGWLAASDLNKAAYNEILSGTWPVADLKYYNSISYDEQWEKVQQKIVAADTPTGEVPVRSLRIWWAAAASVVILILAGWWTWTWQYRPAVSQQEKQMQLADITPAKQGAILTLADGSQVQLDSLGNGIVAEQQGAEAVMSGGSLTYSRKGNVNANSVIYNALTTPRGRQFHLTLPDGSEAWLNAQSSIRYPTSFAEKERRVDISGEVYLEIKKDVAKPFYVNIPGKAAIAVLGTAFNVKAYADEPFLNTTLVSGAVKVSPTGIAQSVTLKPGYSAQIPADRPENIRTTPADLDQVLAWKNGVFYFDNATLQEVMRELSRWYDIEVIFEPGLPETHFGGKINRDVNLAGLLRGLQATGIQFRIEQGRKLVVYK
ncbi:FecR family protein [Chitinophaga sp. CF418]|uniref:FecR family protein n=1 Tax=Chitinophaga sp. CF418 TaxID=1855287 RepID=UPI0009164B8E|nr:FecR family protein [Chitinophaga sp. CF418]SHN36273.1 FecR family protein [Chitinophaga sp. CF418]